MNHFTLPRRAARAGLLALGTLAALAGLSGCSRKIAATVDAGYTTLEGRPDANANLFAWFDTPDTVLYYQDNDPPGPDLPSQEGRTDVLLGRLLKYRTGPGIVNTLLLDGTTASGFQFFRRANNGGLEALTDYPIPTSVKWLPLGWEMYLHSDPKPSAYSPTTYLARGLLDGRVTTLSPVSNEAYPSGPAARATINVRYIPAPPPSVLVRDSSVAWTTVPGAASYWLDIYRFKTTATSAEIAGSGVPSPVLTGNVNHVVLAHFEDAGASAEITYKLGTKPPGCLVMAPLVPDLHYYVRVTAVDTHGRVIAWTRSRTQDEDPYRDDWQIAQTTGYYLYFPLGAIIIPLPKHIF